LTNSFRRFVPLFFLLPKNPQTRQVSDRMKTRVGNDEVTIETCENPSNACQTCGLGKRMDQCNPLFQCCCRVCGCRGTSKGHLLGNTRRSRSRGNPSVRVPTTIRNSIVIPI